MKKRIALPVTGLLLFGACDPPPDAALTVGEAAYMEDEVLGLSSARMNSLAAITAIGLAVADEEIEGLGAPLLERRRRDRLIQKLADEIAVERSGVSDEVLEARYRTDPEQELTVRHLVLRADRLDPAQRREEARRRADAARERIRAGEPFATVAAEVSEEPGASRTGGLLAPGKQGTWVSEFWDAARRLAVGEMSTVVETEYGFHVLRLEARDIVPFAEHRDEVVREVAGLLASTEERDAWLDSIASDLAPREEAIRAWQAEEAADSLVLAEWPAAGGAPAGAFRVADLERYRVSLPGSEGERVRTQPGEAVSDFILQAAREALLAERARQEGFRVSEWDEGRILREWAERVGRWAAAFRFAPGQDVETVKARAMAGLDGTRQDLEIARAEIQRIEPLLRAAYPISMHARGFGEESAEGSR